MRRLVVSLLFLLLFLDVLPATVHIEGRDLSYAGKRLIFLRYGNQVTFQEIPLATVTVSSDGSYSCSFEIDNTTFVFLHTGIYYAYFYAIPGMNCQIELPSHKERLPGERINPYFEETRAQLPVIASGSASIPAEMLNKSVNQFDTAFESVFSKYSMNAFAKIGSSKLDSVIQVMDSTYEKGTGFFFRQYFTYRIGLLRFMFSQYKSRHISDKYFIGKPVQFQNPAYMELLNQVFDKYFSYFAFTKRGKELDEAIGRNKSITQLRTVLYKDTVLQNDTLMGVVLLKNLYDGFYNMDYPREAILQVVDSFIATEKIQVCKDLAIVIRERITRLYPGFDPPSFRLLNQDSTFISNMDFRGTLTYMVFCTTGSYSCVKEFDQLKKIQQKYGNRISVVALAMDESFEDMKKFCKKFPYHWTFLYCGDHPELVKEYDVRTFPSYYLIDPEGKNLLCPAPSPEETIEETLYEYLKSKGQL